MKKKITQFINAINLIKVKIVSSLSISSKDNKE